MPRVFEALASPVRRKIPACLAHAELGAGDIVVCFDLAKPSISGTLQEACPVGRRYVARRRAQRPPSAPRPSKVTMRRALPLALAAAFVSMSARADRAPDLARYDCTRTDDGKTVAGGTLAAAGFQIVSRARFGNVNLMLADPKTSTRANCFLRAPPR